MPGTILIAASDPNIIYLLQRYVEQSGFQAVKVGPGEDVVELAQQITPALIILESDFPGLVDCEVLRDLKGSPETRGIPVVVYSCLDEEAGKQTKGIAGFLQKSVRYDDFLAALKQAGVYA